ITVKDDIFIPYRMADTDNFESLSQWEVIRYVIETEQPIHIEELCRRVAYLYGNQKATSKVRKGVDQAFRYYLAEQIERKNDFICLKDFHIEHVRIPMQKDDYIRPISIISSEELQLALISITKHSFGISPEDLFFNTSRKLGYSRMGTNVLEAIRDAYQELLLKNLIEEVDGKVHLL
ncbi:MAG: DUF3320 domain-containing protein, partial [Bacteroidales bacterium]|nr:DUF3320 domain-containing protein [Bacteroidales bacterium]